jgi:hypothetical protein
LLFKNLRLRSRGCLLSGDGALNLSLLASRPASRLLIADFRFKSAFLSFFYLPELAKLLLLLLKLLVLLLKPVYLSLDEVLFLGLVSLNPHMLWRVLNRGYCFNVEGFCRWVLESHAAGYSTQRCIQITICVQSVLAVSWWVPAGLGGALDYDLAKVIRIPKGKANLGWGLVHIEIQGLWVDPKRRHPGFDSFLGPLEIRFNALNLI